MSTSRPTTSRAVQSKSSSEQGPTLSSSSPDLERHRRILLVTTVGSVAVAGAVVAALVGFLVGLGWWLGALGAAAGAALAWWFIHRTPDQALAAVGAVPLADSPRLENLVDGLCLTLGTPAPRLHIIESAARNAFVVGLSEAQSSMVVTRGLLDHLSRMELEGVVARQLTLVKQGHVARGTIVAAIASIWDGAIARLIESRADVAADIEAVGLTRYPPGLLGALESIGADNVVASAPSWTRHLWIEDPLSPAGGRPSSFHSPIDERLATLREL